MDFGGKDWNWNSIAHGISRAALLPLRVARVRRPPMFLSDARVRRKYETVLFTSRVKLKRRRERRDGPDGEARGTLARDRRSVSSTRGDSVGASCRVRQDYMYIYIYIHACARRYRYIFFKQQRALGAESHAISAQITYVLGFVDARFGHISI